MHRIRTRLTYANVVASIALFAALGGSSYAAITLTGKNVKNGSLTGKDVKRNSLTGKQIKEAGLGTVPRASLATVAGSAGRAASADTLGGRGPGAFAPAGLEQVRKVGAPGQPAYESGWSSVDEGFGGAGFWKDANGVVHLEGAVADEGSPSAIVFTLPPGYRPVIDQDFATASVAGQYATVSVSTNGSVALYPGVGAPDSYNALNGVYFRTR